MRNRRWPWILLGASIPILISIASHAKQHAVWVEKLDAARETMAAEKDVVVANISTEKAILNRSNIQLKRKAEALDRRLREEMDTTTAVRALIDARTEPGHPVYIECEPQVVEVPGETVEVPVLEFQPVFRTPPLQIGCEILELEAVGTGAVAIAGLGRIYHAETGDELVRRPFSSRRSFVFTPPPVRAKNPWSIEADALFTYDDLEDAAFSESFFGGEFSFSDSTALGGFGAEVRSRLVAPRVRWLGGGRPLVEGRYHFGEPESYWGAGLGARWAFDFGG